jgi:hypothetical protein
MFVLLTAMFGRSDCTVNLASDLLGVDLEVRSLFNWPTPQTGNQKTEEWLLSKYGRVPTDAPSF